MGPSHPYSIVCKNAELHHCTCHYQPCTETGPYVPHSGWAAFTANKAVQWPQSSAVRLQSEWPGPNLSGWPPYTKPRKNLKSASKHYLDIPHVHFIKPTVIECSCRWHQDCGLNYQKHPKFQVPWSFQDHPQHSLKPFGLLSMNSWGFPCL